MRASGGSGLGSSCLSGLGSNGGGVGLGWFEKYGSLRACNSTSVIEVVEVETYMASTYPFMRIVMQASSK